MKKISLLAALLSLTFAFSQTNHSFNKFSVEIAYGLSLPISPSDAGSFKAGDFTQFKHIDLGGRYMFTNRLGAKLAYAYDRFQWEGSSLAITYHRIGGSAIYNTIQKSSKFQFQLHGGAGITFASPKRDFVTERIGNIMIGATPILKISDVLAITADLSYNISFKQHYDFGGTLVNANGDTVTGGFMNFTIGLNYYLGGGSSHADWY